MNIQTLKPLWSGPSQEEIADPCFALTYIAGALGSWGGRRAPGRGGWASWQWLVKAQVQVEGQGAAAQPGSPGPQQPRPVPGASHQLWAAQPSPIPGGGEKCDAQSGTLKFNGGDAYLMGLNKASLKTSQTAPRGRGQPAPLPHLSVVASLGQAGLPRSRQSQVRACGAGSEGAASHYEQEEGV